MTIVYQDETWHAVAVELPPRINSDRRRAWARARLERIATDYRTMNAARERWPTKREIKRTNKAAEVVLANMKLSHDARTAVTAQIEARGVGFEMLRRAYSRKADPTRQMLYGRVLDLWRQAGGSLKYSTESDGRTPCGPLIRFLTAVLRPVMDNRAPKPTGCAEIIDKERDRIWVHRVDRVQPELAKCVREGKLSASAAALEAGVRDPI